MIGLDTVSSKCNVHVGDQVYQTTNMTINMMKKLWELKTHESAHIKGLDTNLEESVKTRLYEMGFEEGQPISCTRRSKINGPMVVQLGGTALALEQAIAEQIYLMAN